MSRSGSRAAALIITCAAAALAAPPVPTLTGPVGNAWTQRQADLTYTLPANTTAATIGCDVEVSDPASTVVYQVFVPRELGTQDQTTGNLPDAGFFTWRARCVEDGGLVSAWSAPATFRVDGEGPPAPTNFIAVLDGGFVALSLSVLVDDKSGIDDYHFATNNLGQVDGGVNFGGALNVQPSTPAASLWFGPGTWWTGIHGHDLVGNAGIAGILGPHVVPASATLPQTPTPEVIRFDGGSYPSAPWFPSDFLRLRIDAGMAVTALAVVQQVRPAPTSGEWEYVGSGVGNVVSLLFPMSDQDVRVAMIVGTEVAAWSQPIRLHPDETAPLTPNVTTTIDGGFVTLTWRSSRDSAASGSGASEYRTLRFTNDAGTSFPPQAHVPDASFVVTDAPGFGVHQYQVMTIDRAGNPSSPAVSLVQLAPHRPTGLAAAALVTSAALDLGWNDERDGGYVLTWQVTRLDANDAGQVVAPALTAASFVDDAPEGLWSYEVVAQSGGLASPAARLDGVLRDRTGPTANTPQVTRDGARAAELSWAASDALSGVASANVERETNGLPTLLGVRTSPFVDEMLPDGTHRWRVHVTDNAGNVSSSGWTAAFVTPGSGVTVAALDATPAATCGRELLVELTATEPVTWEKVSGPEALRVGFSSGLVRWTPTEADVGTATFTARASAAGSTDSREFTIEVTCEPEQFGLGCGCQGTGALWLVALAAALLSRRRRGP